jgi:uncharacterized membrane protein
MVFNIKNKKINKILHSPWIDLYIVLITTFLAIVFILIPPFNQTFLRIPFALVLLLFLPGYVFISALFPGRDLSGIERFTLSVGLSIAITVFDGFAISVTVWRFRPTSIVVSLSLIILFFVIITFLMRWRLPYEQRFIPDIRPFIQSLQTKEEMNDIEKALIIAMVGSIIIASGMLIYAKLTFEEEQFTALYILGPGGKAEDYHTNLSFGTPASTIVGIENYEHEPVNYTLQVVLDGGVLSSQSVTLKHKEKWEQKVSFVPVSLGSRLKLEFILFMEGRQYRSVHLWVSSLMDYNQTDYLENFLVTGLQIPNGNMEDTDYWTYMGRGNFTGHYTNQTYVSASHSYEINLSGLDTNNTRTGDYGAISQEFNASKTGLAVLTFDVKDSHNSNTEGNYLKQVWFNDKMIWEDDAAGSEGWEHEETLAIMSQSNRLTLQVYSQKDIQDTNISVWWDNIQFKTLTKMNITHYDPNMTLGVPANLTIAVENYENEFVEYDLEITLDNRSIKTYSFGLNSCEVREWNASFIPEILGSDITLEALLYKKGDKREPYRSTQVYISSTIDYDNLEPALKYASQPPTVHNSNMEYESEWNFEGINFTGTFTNYTAQSLNHSFEMQLPPDTQSNTGDFGAIFQDITAVNYEYPELSVLAVLTFDVNDSIKSNEAGYHLKQALIDDTIIWEDDTAGNEGWAHIEIPVILPQNHKLILRTYELKGSSKNVSVWWDNVRYERFAGQKIISDPEITGTSYSIKEGRRMNLDGDNFKPFTSYETLNMYFSKDNYVHAGDAKYTATVTGGKTGFMGLKYQFLNRNGTYILSRELLDVDKETISLREPRILKNSYNLTLSDIDFDGNLALMELTKNGEVVESNLYNEGETVVFEGDGTVIEYDIENIFGNSVIIKNMKQYSEIPLAIGDMYGEFKITEISENAVEMKNVDPITITDQDSILDGWITLDVSGTTAIPYLET